LRFAPRFGPEPVMVICAIDSGKILKVWMQNENRHSRDCNCFTGSGSPCPRKGEKTATGRAKGGRSSKKEGHRRSIQKRAQKHSPIQRKIRSLENHALVRLDRPRHPFI